jgi:hypothetical protein
MSDHESKTTTDHDTIKAWADERGGEPANVDGTADDQHGQGVLRIIFPGDEESDATGLTIISWDSFFEKFDQENLALLYEEKTSGGETSRFCKFVSR